MRLVQLKVRNFRAYQAEFTLDIKKLTALIGRNDVGKSTLLDALGIFFGADNCKLDAADRCVYAKDEEPCSITCVFEGFPAEIVLDQEAKTALKDECLLNSAGQLEIRKEFSGEKMKEEVFIVAEHPTKDGLGDLLTRKNTDLKKAVGERNLTADQRSNVAMRAALRNAAKDLGLKATQVPVSKEGGKEIWTAIQKLMPMFAIFRADRPSTDDDGEVQDPMKIAVRQAIAKVDAELEKVKRIVEEEVTGVAKRTLERISDYDDKLSKSLTPRFKADPKWDALFKLTLDGDDNIPINKRGSGVRRLILLGFFQAEAERRRESDGQRDIIYAIEEPETSQHPTNQVAVIEAVKELATLDGCQVLITTHVPALAALLPSDSITYIVKESTLLKSKRGEGILKTIAGDLGVIPDLQDGRAQVIVCMEGPTDIEFLTNIAQVLRKKDASLPDIGNDARIAMIPLGGDTLKSWVNKEYLKDLARPEVHIYDGDKADYQVARDQVNARNPINVAGHKSWAVVTQKREIENYIHTDALKQVIGIAVQIGDQDDVEAVVRQAIGQKRFRGKSIKRLISEDVAKCMTKAMLDSRGGTAEITSWLLKIQSYLQ